MILKTIIVLTTATCFCFLSSISMDMESDSFLGRIESEVEDYCDANQKLRLQIVFVFDRTYTFYFQRTTFADFSRTFISSAQKSYPGSEFGVVSFADYDPAAGLTDPVPHHGTTNEARAELLLGPHSCYQIERKLTTDASAIQNAFSNLPFTVGANGTNWQIAESGLTADTTLGWVKGLRDSSGTVVRKIVALVTDATSTRKLRDESGRHEVRGDGTDLCNNTLPPSDQIVERILRENQMSVIGLYHIDVRYNNISVLDYYQDIFGRMDIPYQGHPIAISNTNNILMNTLAGIRGTIECTPGDPEPYNTLGL
ncbi:unnamed protein product [Orchesella dallaii]|uniref:VWFA domain-containing protein n=1 Tax=Orchesella dallaii TaxID=48710 RepID=A0ABP1Q774_9HEXA